MRPSSLPSPFTALKMSDEAILQELVALREAVETLTAIVSPLTPADLRLLETALPIVAATVGDKAFATVDLFDVPELASALDGHSAASLSWLFRRAAGRRIAGVRIEAAGRDRNSVLWAAVTFPNVTSIASPERVPMVGKS